MSCAPPDCVLNSMYASDVISKYGFMASLQVVKTVYASPSRVNFHLDSKKASMCCENCYFLELCLLHLNF